MRDDDRPLTPQAAGALLGVSRETLAMFQAYVDELLLWNRRINLVAATTLKDPWRRHIVDSAQLYALVPVGARRLVDLGSGAGLPGLILAICGMPETHLIESDKRKAAFLRHVAAGLALPVTVHAQRIEATPPMGADVITARGLAPLPRLLELAAAFTRPATRFLLLEGRSAEADLIAARREWTMGSALQTSLSARDGRIVVLDEVRRAAIGAE
jgi:16S rRNA (guanine527-N7)-methyltransferase